MQETTVRKSTRARRTIDRTIAPTMDGMADVIPFPTEQSAGSLAEGPSLVRVRPSEDGAAEDRRGTSSEKWRRRLRDRSCRALNVLASSIGLLLAAPLMLLIAVAVRLSSPGPVIYRQQRVGVDRRSGDGRRRPEQHTRRRSDRGGRIFTIYKFRTMTHSQSKDSLQVWAKPEDPRITGVGAVLRKYRLDELPQLFNVLKGDMNLVGPRPEQPEIFQELRREVDGYEKRQKVLPGITGWAQVNHHYDQCIEDVKTKVHLDLEYIERRSALQDLKIMARTLPVMVGRKGAV